MTKESEVLAFLTLFLASAFVLPISAATPAMYAFGDSTTDAGNYLPEETPIYQSPPYGIDYPGGIPTGRVCNGFLTVDFIAQAIAEPESPPPFLTITNELQTVRGVNFAGFGAGILNTTGQNVITLDEQIEDFKKIVANLTVRVGALLAALQLKKSVFYISIGNNDLIQNFMLLRPVTDAQKDQLVASIIIKFREQLQNLYKLGARKYAVVGVGPIGCAPVTRVSYSPSLACVDDLNDLTLRMNNAIKASLENLSTTLEGLKYSFVDFYQFGIEVIENPSLYGFTEVKSACCGGGRLNAEVQCGTANTTYCSDRKKYLFWDNLHPTQAFYKLLALSGAYGVVAIGHPHELRQSSLHNLTPTCIACMTKEQRCCIRMRCSCIFDFRNKSFVSATFDIPN